MTYATRMQRAAAFTESLRIGNTWRFRTSQSADDTVYASCFAAMIWRYTGWLARRTSQTDRQQWAAYLNSFQDPKTGYYMVPEVARGRLLSDAHDQEHLLMHFCAHVLPALDALGARPRHPLAFAEAFIQPRTLDAWLAQRDWRRAWIEGNNLLFVGQFLIHLAETGGHPDALGAVHRLLDWLDREADPETGLWGTNGFCGAHEALYGGYHQLLLYFYLGRPLPYPEALVSTVLRLQHFDGGFHEFRGGGTCQDVDAIDVLVNTYKRHAFGRRHVRRALQVARGEVLSRQLRSGGFINRKGQEFCHMGIAATRTPAGEGEIFSTWFGVHTLLLMREILDGRQRSTAWSPDRFNRVCSMGWHDGRLWVPEDRGRLETALDCTAALIRRTVVSIYEPIGYLRDSYSSWRRPADGHPQQV